MVTGVFALEQPKLPPVGAVVQVDEDGRAMAFVDGACHVLSFAAEQVRPRPGSYTVHGYSGDFRQVFLRRLK